MSIGKPIQLKWVNTKFSITIIIIVVVTVVNLNFKTDAKLLRKLKLAKSVLFSISLYHCYFLCKFGQNLPFNQGERVQTSRILTFFI